ncbi:MAG: Gfo/Idh/MocA family oxidoreductase [Halofilum sp. (in: g-proteobacteria)]|nr:Gfo/Idh/MocA family oxidoreductase [Halofilum sp. (in: g-proteobacteria)]
MSIATAVVGVGYLGRFHAQKYAALPGCELVGVADPDEAAAAACAGPLGVPVVVDYHELLGHVDAVSIAVPTSLHHRIALDFLEHGSHVLVEKPITVTVAEADELVAAAGARGLVLQVGHLERFNPALRAADAILATPRFIESHRLAPFNPRGTDVDVVLDLMIHDIDIILDVVRSPLVRADASGAEVLTGATDIVNARLVFESGCVANVTASRVSAKKERRMRFFQHDCYLAVDFQDHRLTLHRKGEQEMYPGIPELVTEERQFEAGDAIRAEIESFLESVSSGTPPLVSGEDGRRALAAAIDITARFGTGLT